MSLHDNYCGVCMELLKWKFVLVVIAKLPQNPSGRTKMPPTKGLLLLAEIHSGYFCNLPIILYATNLGYESRGAMSRYTM